MIRIPSLTTEEKFEVAKLKITCQEHPKKVLAKLIAELFEMTLIQEKIIKELINENLQGEMKTPKIK